VVSRLMAWLRRRHSCICTASTVLYPTARIVNGLLDRAAIRIGEHTHVRGELLTFGHGGFITIGDYCYVGDGTRVWSGKRVAIGHRVLISHNVNIFDNLVHPYNARARHNQFKQIVSVGQPRQCALDDRPIDIQDDVLIGAGATILRGVTIGRGAIVGAASVVTADVPPYVVVAGNPARVVRSLPVEDQVAGV
jgi:acetyltransferase-like isoleucine patch superfamily enzyme